MKDGLYLSTYLSISAIANVYSLPLRHDHNISLWSVSGRDVFLRRVWELERYTGKKQHSTSFISIEHAKDFISSMLKEENLTFDDIVDIWGTPNLETEQSYRKKEWEQYPIHTLAHMANGFFSDTRIFRDENILVFSVDGGPDSIIDQGANKNPLFIAAYSKRGENDIQITGCYSPGVIWASAASLLGMREGSLMALAYASDSHLLKGKYYNEVLEIFSINNKNNAELKISALHDAIFCLTKENIGICFSGFDARFSEEENRISMMIKVIQEVSIKIMEENIERVINEFQIDPKETVLSIQGGYALNCPTNSYLLQKYHFKKFASTPHVSDTGISIGFALLAFYNNLVDFNFSLNNPYYGHRDDDNKELKEDVLHNQYVINSHPFNDDVFVNDIDIGPVVWFSGASEIGPRALGNRSILGDPRKIDTKDKLNAIKQRKWWRPVAPVVLYEHMQDWFDKIVESPFMLLIFDVKAEKRNSIPAIAHLDYSSRVQTLRQQDNPLLYRAIAAFFEKTGVPILCNTSLNDQGEPIINNISEAINFCIRKKIPVCYYNGIRLELDLNKFYPYKGPLPRIFFTDCLSEDKKNRIKAEYNPHQASQRVVHCFYSYPFFFRNLDIRNAKHIKSIERVINYLFGE